jgi:iron complex outermembrane receptor protein
MVSYKQHVRAGLFLSVAVATLAASGAMAQQLTRIVIPAQAMAPALRELSRQTGVNILFEPKTAQGRMAPAIGDALTPEEAARRLVSASGLEVARDATGSLLIREAPRAESKSSSEFLKIAAVSAVQSAAAQPAALVEAAPSAGLEEVVVTASRVRTGFTAPTPTTVVGEAAIEKRGVTNVADVLNEVPAFRATFTASSTTRSSAFSGGTFLDLRGLNGNDAPATARTLVLVDGHRYQPSTANMLVDLNMIPTSLIERTEVVTGGASAAWGSDAIAGVVNLILKSRIEGWQGGVGYGSTDKGDNREYSANLATGNTFAGGKGHFIIGADYVDNQGVPDPYVSRAWGREGWGAITNTAVRAAGVPQKVVSAGVTASSRFTPGGVIVGGPLAGAMFLPGGATTQFVPGSLVSGDSQIGCPTCSNYGINLSGGSLLENPVERWTALARANYEITDRLEIWGELSQGQSWYDGLSGQRRDNAAITVQRDNAFLPSPVAAAMLANNLASVTVGRLANDPGYGTPGQGGGFYARSTHLKLTRAAGGFKGAVFDNWKWDISGETGKSEYTQFGQATNSNNYFAAIDAVRDSSGNIVCRPGANLAKAAPGCVPFNIFGQGSPSQAAIKYVMDFGTNHVVLQENDLAANITGDLFQLPAGPVSIAAGAEYRSEQVATDTSAASAAGLLDTASYKPFSGAYHDEEVYAETVVPLLLDMTFAHSLGLNAAVRETNYSTSGAVTTWKLGATYEPTPDFRFRVTRSRDIRAPNLNELYQKGNLVFSTVINPRTGQSGQISTFITGNPNLVPEQADTVTGGVVFQPTFFPGFHASLDYYNILINGVIGQVLPQNIINGCEAGDQSLCSALKYTGNTLNTITQFSLNLNKLQTQGYDIEVAYRVPQAYMFNLPGQVSLSALGTNVRQIATTSVTAAGVPGVIDRAGQTAPKWAWNFTTNYDLGRFSAQAQVRFLDGVVIDSTYLDPSDAGYASTLPNSTNYNHEPDVAYLNLSLQYTLLDSGHRSVTLYGVANNVFDVAPGRFDAGNGGNASPYDLIGRTFRIGARFKY